MEQLAVLKKVVKKLCDLGIEYMLSGSVAMNFYGQPRMTRDIDIVILVRESQIKNLVDAFKEEFYIDTEMVSKEVSRKGMFNVLHNEYIIKVDFILRKDAEFDINVFERRKLVTIDETEISLISPEDLVLNKLVWARESNSEIQKKDVKNILMMTADLDLDYIRHWSKRLHVAALLKECEP
jgi:predicted nucleotidyltransferase